MQFFTTAIAALSMSSVFAAPVAEPRADNAISTVFNTVADVKLTVTDELSTVSKYLTLVRFYLMIPCLTRFLLLSQARWRSQGHRRR